MAPSDGGGGLPEALVASHAAGAEVRTCHKLGTAALMLPPMFFPVTAASFLRSRSRIHRWRKNRRFPSE